MWRLAASLIVVCPAASLSFAVPISPRVTVTEFPEAVVVYVHDLDLLRAAHSTLTAEVRLAGVDVTYHADLAATCQTPAIFIRKAKPQSCGEVAVAIRSGDKDLFREDLATGPTVQATPRVPTTDVKAFIEPGRGMGEAPTILQPDIAKLSPLSLSDAKWSLDMNAIVARVESDVNFPLVSANNNCAITRQTAHQEDPTRRSCYVPFKSQIYDEETGNASRVIHYLVEVPLDPAWLNGTEDADIMLDAEQIRVHTTRKRWPPGNPRGQFITGQGAGGLGQLVGSVAVDAKGSIYYSASVPSHVVRFNVAKAEFEPPPIDIMAAMNEYLPKREDMPEAMRGKGARWDTYGYVATGGGRLFFSPVRYADYGTVYCSGVFSFPLEHWYDADKFRAGLRFLAGSWPGSPAALYDQWPTAGAAAQKVAPGVYHDSKYWMTSYANARGGSWCIELNEDGSPKGFRVVTHADVSNTRRAAQPMLRERAGGCIDWSHYGALTTTRAQLSQALTGTHSADRGGGPYCTGLQTFSPADPTELLALSHMSRGSSTYLLRTRLLVEPDGRKLQQFVLAGGRSVKAYILMMGGKDLPGNPDAKHFLYECPEGEEPTDVVGFSAPVVNGSSGITCQVFSRDRRYLVTLQHGSILTFDLANWHYVDGRRLDAEVWEFSRPDYCFVVAPDDRIFLCAQAKDAAKATFHELDISSAGVIAIKPHLTITAPNTAALRPIEGAVITFVADPKWCFGFANPC